MKVLDNKIPLTRIQKLIGKLMQQSKHQMPCFYLESKTDLTNLGKTRKSYCKAIGTRVTTNDFFYCAIARAINQFPLMAGKMDKGGKHIQIAEKIGIGFAVAAPQGLVVPVIQDSGEKSLDRIATESSELLKKARANKLMPYDFDGANVVLSALGMYGINSFLAIVPPGATGIISIGTINNTVVHVDDKMAIRKTMSVALAANRKIVDEFYAAKFLTSVVDQLENPATLTGQF